MTSGLRRFQHNNCYIFAERLMRLKGRMSDKNELKRNLESLHKAFLKMKASIDICMYEKESHEEPTVENTKTGIFKYKTEEFIFLVVDGRIIGLEGVYYQELEPFVVNKPVGEIMLISRMYADFKTRNCDLCGSYFYADTFEAPLGRALEKDFISAFHYSCKKKDSFQ